MEYGSSKVMPLLILSHEDIAASVLVVLSVGSFPLEEASCHVKNTLRQPCGEVHVMRNCGLLPTAKEEWRTSTNSLVGELSLKLIL